MSFPELAPARRLLWMAGAFGSLLLASPGVSSADGSALLAVVAVGLWSAAAVRPGPRAVWVEGAVGGLGWCGVVQWAAYVHPVTLLWLGSGYALYVALSGVLLRFLARSFPLPLAAAAAWLFAETLRAVAPLPFGQEWMRLGTHLHAHGWLAGSARVWGIEGLGLVLAAAGGLLGVALRRARPRGPDLALGLAPLVLGVLFARLVPVPETVPGPRVLLVQPGIPQERKMRMPDPGQLFLELVELTLEGLQAEEAAGAPQPDLVCWGESMLPASVVDPALLAEVDAGARLPAWAGVDWGREQYAILIDNQRYFVDDILLGGGGREQVLPTGTAFLSGAEHLTVRDGVVRRQSGVFLWTAPGDVRGPVTKRFLVPSAETMFGLERFDWVRSLMQALAGYVPDLHSDVDAPRRLEFTGRDGRPYRIGASVCYDNAFDEPFTRPLREGPVDFHVVVSNEAWFERSLEFDQMMAFSRLEALATGRSVVRATNSGVSAVLGPDGGEVGRLRSEGRDRDVRGTLCARVPVPRTEAESALRTIYVRSERFWAGLLLLGPLLLVLLAVRRRVPLAPGEGT